MKQTVVSGSLVHDNIYIWQIKQLQSASCMKHTVVTFPLSHDLAYIQQRKLWFLCTLQLLLRRRRNCKHKLALVRVLTLLLLLGGDIESNPGPSKQWLKNQADKQRYLLQGEEIFRKKRLQYAEEPQHKKEASKADYAATPQRKRAVARANYAANPEPKRTAAKVQYAANPQSKRDATKAAYAANVQSKQAAAKAVYAANPQPKRAAAKALYATNAATKRANARIRYQTHPHVFRAAVKKYYERRKDTVNSYCRGKYNLREAKAIMKAQLAKELQQKLFTLPVLRLSLRLSFKHAHESIAKCMSKAKLNKSVCRIAVKWLLDCVWKKRRETAGLLLKSV